MRPQIEKGMRLIAAAIEAGQCLELSRRDLLRIYIDAGFGVDNRTIKKWTEIALALGLLGQRGKIFVRGSEFQRFIDEPVKPSDASDGEDRTVRDLTGGVP